MPGLRCKVQRYGLEKKVLALRGEGKTYQEIADCLSTPERPLSLMAVQRFLDSHADLITQVVARTEKLQIAQAAQHLDVVAQLNYVNQEALAILSELRKKEDHGLALKALARIEQQLRLSAELLGQITPQPATVIFNIVRVEQPPRAEPRPVEVRATSGAEYEEIL